jgi:heme-degrading monooxygenase HmoA
MYAGEMYKTIAAIAAGFALGAATTPHAVARIWHGRVPSAKADEYQRYLYESGVKKLKAIPKNQGVQMLRRDDGQTAEFIVISFWPDKDAIHAYAGADIEKVHQLPRDPAYLVDPETLVKHFEVIADER